MGGTMEATVKLVKQLGGSIAGLAFAVELDFLKGRERFNGIPRVQPAALRRIATETDCKTKVKPLGFAFVVSVTFKI